MIVNFRNVSLSELHSPLVGLICCDECGVVAVDLIARQARWRMWREHTPFGVNASGWGVSHVTHHHCPQHVEINENIASGLVYRVDPSTAQTYDDWGTR